MRIVSDCTGTWAHPFRTAAVITSLPAAFLSSMLVGSLNTSVTSAGAKVPREFSGDALQGLSRVGRPVTSVAVLLKCMLNAEAMGRVEQSNCDTH